MIILLTIIHHKPIKLSHPLFSRNASCRRNLDDKIKETMEEISNIELKDYNGSLIEPDCIRLKWLCCPKPLTQLNWWNRANIQ